MAARTFLQDGGIVSAEWVLTTADPTGDAIVIPYHSDICATIEGTFGGATVDVQGHNHPTPTSGTFLLLSKMEGATGPSSAQETVQACIQILESPFCLRPILSVVGVGASITVRVKATRSR